MVLLAVVVFLVIMVRMAVVMYDGGGNDICNGDIVNGHCG